MPQLPNQPLPDLTEDELNALTSDASHFLHDWVRASMRTQLQQKQAQQASLGLLESLMQTFSPRISQLQAAKAVSHSEKALRRSR
jgi:hypothetical protein